MSPQITTTVLHALNALIGLLSVVVLALVAHSVVLTDSIGDAYAQDAKGTGRAMLFWPGVGGIVDMLLFIILWYMTPVAGSLTRKRKAYWNGLLFVASFIFGRPFIVLMYAFVERNQASKSQTTPSHGFITPESWACAVASSGGSVEDADSVCMQLRAARYLLIPITVLGAAMLALVISLRIRLARQDGQVVAPEPALAKV